MGVSWAAQRSIEIFVCCSETQAVKKERVECKSKCGPHSIKIGSSRELRFSTGGRHGSVFLMKKTRISYREHGRFILAMQQFVKYSVSVKAYCRLVFEFRCWD